MNGDTTAVAVVAFIGLMMLDETILEFFLDVFNCDVLSLAPREDGDSG